MQGTVIKRMGPGDPGTKKLTRQYGNSLYAVRYRYDESKRSAFTTVELVLPGTQRFHDRSAVQGFNKAMSIYGESS